MQGQHVILLWDNPRGVVLWPVGKVRPEERQFFHQVLCTMQRRRLYIHLEGRWVGGSAWWRRLQMTRLRLQVDHLTIWLVTVPFTFKKVPLKISSFLFLNHANLLHPKPFSILLGSYVSFNSKITFVQLPLSFEKKWGKGRGLGGCAQAIPRLLNASTRGTSTFDLVLTNLQN